MHDFRSFIKLLDDRGELVRISREVEPRQELAGVMSKIETQRRAYFFENVTGAKFPLIGGLYNKLEKFGMALGHDSDEPFTHKLFDARIEAAKANPIAPNSVKSGPVKEVICTGNDVDLVQIPVPDIFRTG